MKKLLVDARMIHETPHGIARYVEGIALGLKSKMLNYDLEFLVTERTPKSSPVFLFRTVLAQSRFLSPHEWLEIPKILKQGRYDAFHSPSLSAYPYLPVPYMVTIHDLNHLHYGGALQKLYYQSLLKYFAKHAAVLSTISQFSQNEISQWLRDTREIQIIPNAFERIDAERLSQPLSAPRSGYFFSITGTKPHKNLRSLLSGYEKYRSLVQDPLPLYVTAPAEQEGVVSLLNLTDTQDLLSWLKFARGCLFPSLYEGFGRSPIEAAIAGSKIALSDIPPHREGLERIQSQGLRWVNPKSADDWSRALSDLHHDQIPAVSVQDSTQLQAQFSVESVANTIDPIYRGMLIV